MEQDKTDFDLNIRKLVKQFNLQAQRVHIAARTDATAQRRADVARRLYLLGQSTILDLNASITEKDSARRNYVTALYDYWSLYYTLRSLTLYDFGQDRPLDRWRKIWNDLSNKFSLQNSIPLSIFNYQLIKWISNSKRNPGTSVTVTT